ncbi:MAG TPA: hypothetical protein VM492_15165 [Sumerlaeia bacterium]|nr:hypothetical protein [Sumerlaeia bacterium]
MREIEVPATPYAVTRLENGNTLISCGAASRVIEIAADKQAVWTGAKP